MAVSPLHVLYNKKRRGERIAMISLYDAPGAKVCCDAGVDVLLVGDSMGNVILGFDNTIPVTVEAIAHHTAAVMRGAKSSTRPEVPVIADMPFGSYHGSRDNAVRNGTLLMQAGAHALKLEGAGDGALEAIEQLVDMGAPVMGHLGFTPQSALKFQEVVQGKTASAAHQLLAAARRLEDAGCCGIVLEVMPMEVAARITEQLTIPTIGIGAGAGCDGQVLVWHDLAGLSEANGFRFVKRYADTHAMLAQAARDYVKEVQSGEFPASSHAWTMPQVELEEWQQADPSNNNASQTVFEVPPSQKADGQKVDTSHNK